MRKFRFHLPGLVAGRRAVSGSEAQHLTQVLRVSPGSSVRAFDGRGYEADGVIVEVEPGRVVVDLGEPRRGEVEAALAVTVAVSLLKGDKLADVVRQCTELGAFEFRPLLAERRDVPVLSVNKLERLRRVAREAAKQSGRTVVPHVAEAMSLAALPLQGRAFLAHPQANLTLAQASAGIENASTLITGPEGGFSDDEVEALAARGVVPVRLGARILRAETAPVALLAALLVREAL